MNRDVRTQLDMLQGFWKGVLPSIVMVSNPSVNYMLYEYLRARLEDWRRVLSVDDGKFRRTSPAGALCLVSPTLSAGLIRPKVARVDIS